MENQSLVNKEKTIAPNEGKFTLINYHFKQYFKSGKSGIDTLIH